MPRVFSAYRDALVNLVSHEFMDVVLREFEMALLTALGLLISCKSVSTTMLLILLVIIK